MTAGARTGQAGLIVVLNLTLMFAVLGFAVDFGLGQFRKHAAQTAADAAAMAAASWAAANGSSCGSGVTCNVSTACTIPNLVSTPFGAGCVYAQSNGYTQGGNGNSQTVSLLANNTSSPVTGNVSALWFKAIVGETDATMFGSFAGVKSFTIAASAVAGVNTSGGADCLIALGTSGTTFSASGSGNVTGSNCGFYGNGNMSNTGSGRLQTVSTTGGAAPAIQYYGTYSGTASSPVATKATSALGNPFSGVTAPAVSSTCDYTSFSSASASPVVLFPGVYCGGIKLSNAGSVTFSTGTYIINGTDAGGKSFEASGSGSLSGANVTFFITGQNGYTAGPISLTGSGGMTFSAPSTGSLKGLLFYQDPNATYATANAYTGSGSANVSGSFYFPTTSLTYTASGSISEYQAIVANAVTFTGSGSVTFLADATGQYTGLVKTVASLIQ